MAYHGDSALIDPQTLKLARRVASGATLTACMHRGDADRALKKLLKPE